MRKKHFYKFRNVSSNLDKDYALEALINSFAIFSGRNNFNDLFDSKIDIQRPTSEMIEELFFDPRIGRDSIVGNWVSGGKFTSAGLTALDDMEKSFNKMIDSYPIYSLSSSVNCDLLWAHYASSHTGFCIEFEFPDNNQPQRISYQKHIESIPLIDFIKSYFGIGRIDLANKIYNALHVKTNCWSREAEYRWIASNEMGRIPEGKKFIKISYDPRWVKAIIFGCRTSQELKTYIQSNLKFDTQFKQAITVKDRIEIVPFV